MRLPDAFRYGFSVDEIFNLTFIDRWFLYQIHDLIDDEKAIAQKKTSRFI